MVKTARLFGKEIVRIGTDNHPSLHRELKAITFFQGYCFYHVRNKEGKAWIGFSYGTGRKCFGIEYSPTVQLFHPF